MKEVHQTQIRVYYPDTDAGGVVYHAIYLNFAERARTEMLREAGLDQLGLLKNEVLAFAVVSANVQYKTPARLDDLLTVKTSVVKMGGASMEMQQDIYRDDVLLVTLAVTLVCIDKSFKAVRLPKAVREIFAL